MALINILTDVKVWVFGGIIAGLLIGPLGDITSNLLIVVLMLMMIAAMEGLRFGIDDIKKEKSRIIIAILSCMVLNTATSLAAGLLFIESHEELWMGWVMLAAVPSAVSVISLTFYLRGNMKVSIISSAFVYILSLGFTPLLTFLLIGDAVSPLQIFKYVLLFIAVPLLMTFPLRKFNIDRQAKVIFINIMMFLLMTLSLGSNRDFILSNGSIVFVLLILCVLRAFGVSLVMLFISKKLGLAREDVVVYMGMGIQKNSGLSISLCFILLPLIPQAAIPCALTVLVDSVWFAFMTWYIERSWPLTSNPVYT